MTIDEIMALVAAGESRSLELKKRAGELKYGMHAAHKFLNTKIECMSGRTSRNRVGDEAGC